MILDRYILREVLRVLLLTTVVLTTVIAFGATIKPLAQNLLGPADLVKYIAVATVPMLQFALPFASGFAATLVMHRLAADNEVLAMTVAGMSYRRILFPMIVLGLVLALIMLVLVHFVIPRFGKLLQDIIASDVTRLFVAAVDDGRSLRIGDVEIFADEVQVLRHPEDSEAQTRLLLAGVAAVQTASDGEPVEFTAEFATVDVYRLTTGTFLKPALVNATVFRADEGTLVMVPQALPDAARIEGTFGNPLNFLTLPEMLRFNESRIDTHRPVADRRAAIAAALLEGAAWDALQASLDSGEPLRLQDDMNSREVLIVGASLEGDVLTATDGGRLRIVETIAGRPEREGIGTAARLVFVAPIGRDGRPGFDLLFEAPEVNPLREGLPGGGRWPPRLGPLRLADWTPEPYADMRWSELAERAEGFPEEGPGPRAPIAAQARAVAGDLRAVVLDTDRNLHARITKRTALSLAAPLVLMLGSVLAIWLRRSVPLAVYMIAFLPAILSTLVIAGGEELLKDGTPWLGHAVLWSGNALLLALLLGAWLRMARN